MPRPGSTPSASTPTRAASAGTASTARTPAKRHRAFRSIRPQTARTTTAPRMASGRSWPTRVTVNTATTMTAAPIRPASWVRAPARVVQGRARQTAAHHDAAEGPRADVRQAQGDQLLVGVDLVAVPHGERAGAGERLGVDHDGDAGGAGQQAERVGHGGRRADGAAAGRSGWCPPWRPRARSGERPPRRRCRARAR